MIVQKGWLTRASLGQCGSVLFLGLFFLQGSSITQCMTHAIKFHDNPIKASMFVTFFMSEGDEETGRRERVCADAGALHEAFARAHPVPSANAEKNATTVEADDMDWGLIWMWVKMEDLGDHRC